jgi:metallophosphoesterase superfamily enzyme
MSHLHSAVILSDKENIKREKFKCFLVGNYKRKRVIILPSFFEIVEGTNVNDYEDEYGDYFSILPKKAIVNFEVYAIGENHKFYNFGKIKDLK